MSAPEGGRPRLLVVDDAEAVLQIMIDMLAQAGFKVEGVRRAADVLDRLHSAVTPRFWLTAFSPIAQRRTG